MPFDGAMAEEELLADLRVREAIVSQASDLRFLRRERLVGVGGALARRFASGQQFDEPDPQTMKSYWGCRSAPSCC